MNPDLQRQYTASNVLSASPVRLVVLLYEGAIRYLRCASAACQANNIPEFGAHLTRAQDVITELKVALDLEKGGAIAKDLARLYDFVGQQLIQARLRRDAQSVENAISILSTLKEAWDRIAGSTAV